MFKNPDLNRIYLSESVRKLALGLIDVFIPIILLTNGYSFAQVIFFYIVISITHMALAVPAGYIGARIGYKYLILLSAPFFIAFYLLFKDVSALAVPLWTLGILREAGATLYWVGRHSLLGFHTDRGRTGRQLSIGQIINSLVVIPAPLIGGAFLSMGDMRTLIGAVAVLLVLSTVPLFFIRENWIDRSFSTRSLFSRFHLSNVPIFLTQGMDNIIASDVVWPTYAYLFILTRYVALGFVGFLSNIVSLASNYLAGHFTDVSPRRTMRAGALADLGLWIFRVSARLPIQIYAIDSAYGLADQFVQLPFGSSSYQLARDGRFLQLIVFRELAIHSGKLLALFAVLALGSFQNAAFLGLIYPLGYLVFRFRFPADPDRSVPSRVRNV